MNSNSKLKSNNIFVKNNITVNNNSKQEALEYWDKLNDINLGFKTATAIVAIAAAGFWAASWFLGLSVSWAIAATTVVASLGVTVAGISYYLNVNNKYRDNIIKSIKMALSIRTLAHSFWDIIFPILTANVTIVTETSVVMPAFSAILATTSAFFGWILGTKIFAEADNNEKNKLKIEEGKLNPKIDVKKTGYMSSGSTYDYAIIKFFKWTDYATSWEKFLKYYDYINLNDSVTEAGGQGTTVQRKNIKLSTKLISDTKIEKNNTAFPFKQNIIRYDYRLIVAYQTAEINMYLYRDEEEIHGLLEFHTQSANAIYRVWNSLKVSSFDVTNNAINELT
ncbi:hypothetical protein [Spiroplasma endosymbiont of Glossina fuscipes fuscipes]|uniref:hypothetical protein n=1 Tax=Spiroplasma endosymbiont of Glossina fuscipes fuscipes TaxID=2004463 RepID=UPI003CEB7D4D